MASAVPSRPTSFCTLSSFILFVIIGFYQNFGFFLLISRIIDILRKIRTSAILYLHVSNQKLFMTSLELDTIAMKAKKWYVIKLLRRLVNNLLRAIRHIRRLIAGCTLLTSHNVGCSHSGSMERCFARAALSCSCLMQMYQFIAP